MGFLQDYKEAYERLTGKKLRWKTGFGFAYQRQGGQSQEVRHTLAKCKDLKYEDPELYVRLIRERCTYLHDPTLRELMDEHIGDFGELWEPEPEEEDEAPEESWSELVDSAY